MKAKLKVIHELIKQSGLSHEQFSRLSGISHTTIVYVVTGDREFTDAYRKRMYESFLLYAATYEKMKKQFSYLYDSDNEDDDE